MDTLSLLEKKSNVLFICNSQHRTVCKTDCKLAGSHELLLHKKYIIFSFTKDILYLCLQ